MDHVGTTMRVLTLLAAMLAIAGCAPTPNAAQTPAAAKGTPTATQTAAAPQATPTAAAPQATPSAPATGAGSLGDNDDDAYIADLNARMKFKNYGHSVTDREEALFIGGHVCELFNIGYTYTQVEYQLGDEFGEMSPADRKKANLFVWKAAVAMAPKHYCPKYFKEEDGKVA